MADRNIDLRPIQQIVDEIRAEAQRDIEQSKQCILERAEELVRRVEMNRIVRQKSTYTTLVCEN